MNDLSLRHFLEKLAAGAGGLLEEVEPEVYDMLLPDMAEPARLTLDPEALPEHPRAEMVAFGSAVLDSLLARARAMGRAATAFVEDVNLAPHGIEQRAAREFLLPEGAQLSVEAAIPRHVTYTLFWFKVTYVSDSKEESLASVGIDRYYGRQVKALADLSESGRLVEQRTLPIPDTPSIPLDEGYAMARNRLLRTLSSEIHLHEEELRIRLSAQRSRLRSYFEDLRDELEQRRARMASKEEDLSPLEARRAALDREEALRMDEINRHSAIHAEMRLVNVLHIKAPRLFLTAHLTADPRLRVRALPTVTLTWDTLNNHFDAAPCPACNAPTFEFVLSPKKEIGCPRCAGR